MRFTKEALDALNHGLEQANKGMGEFNKELRASKIHDERISALEAELASPSLNRKQSVRKLRLSKNLKKLKRSSTLDHNCRVSCD